jgi:hypothetical protein
MLARQALDGVGDPSRGEWPEVGANGVVHLRRRLTGREQERVGNVRDIRGLPEERRRLALLFRDAPHLGFALVPRALPREAAPEPQAAS